MKYFVPFYLLLFVSCAVHGSNRVTKNEVVKGFDFRDVYQDFQEHRSNVAARTTNICDIDYLEAYDVTDSRISLRWNITDEQCPVEYYSIIWSGRVLCIAGQHDAGSDLSSTTTYILTSLTPYTNYTLTVTAILSNGTTGNGKVLPGVVTDQAVPGSPENPTSSAISSSSVQVSWEPPLECNGILLNYTVSWKFAENETIVGSGPTPDLTYQVDNLVECEDYKFDITASTSAGESSPATTTTTTTPEPPPSVTNLTTSDVTSQSVTLTWVPPDTNCPLLNYTLDGIGVVLWEEYNHTVTVTISGGDTSYVVQDLIPWTNYTLCLAAITDGGSSSPACIDMMTLEDVPSEPTDLTADILSNTEVLLHWNAPVELNGVIVYYNVTWEPESGTTSFQTTIETELSITDLNSCSTYNMSVAGATVVGEGSSSSTSAYLNVEVSPPPAITTCQTLDSTTISLEWSAPDSDCQVLNYSVTADGITLWNGMTTVSSEYTDKLKLNLTDLVPYTDYVIYISGSTEAGFGAASLCSETTDEDVPSPPLNLREHAIQSEVLLQWDPPEMLNGIFLGYNVTWESEGIGLASQITSNTELRLDVLTGCLTYIVNVMGLTAAGQGDPASINVTISEEAPPAPKITRCEAINSTTVELEWDASNTLCPVTYNVTVNGTILWNGTKTYFASYTDDLTITVSHLVPYSDYVFFVVPNTTAGVGAPGICTLITEEDVPSSPVYLSVVFGSVTSTSFSISWLEPEEKNGVLKGFNATLDNGMSGYVPYTKPDDSYQLDFTGLEPATNYTISVYAENGAGYGNPAITYQLTNVASGDQHYYHYHH